MEAMKLSYFVLVLACLTASVKPSLLSETKFLSPHKKPSDGRIIGGEEATPHSFPYIAGLWINGGSFCAGSLISTNYILTAGHCGIVIASVRAVLGAHNLSQATEENQVSIRGGSVLVHEGYDDYFLYHDVALIKLAETVVLDRNIQIATLPRRSDEGNSYSDKVTTAIGWGLLKDIPYPSSNDISDVLVRVDVAVVNLTACQDFYNDGVNFNVTEHNLCTSGYRNKGTCNGDSGGPLVLDDVIIAITSFGTDLCEVCSPSVYTRVVDYLDWITSNSDVNV